MCARAELDAVQGMVTHDLLTKLRTCSNCTCEPNTLSPVERIEQLMRLREEALVEMNRIAHEMLEGN